MFRILVAELFVDIEPRFPLIEEWCRDYIVPRQESIDPDVMIHISDPELQQELNTCPYQIAPEEAEVICVSKALGKELLRFDAFFLHAATFIIDGKTYAISAASGTGKTTLLRRCKELLGRRVGIINGDKPIIKYTKGSLTAYGSPWCGKERWGENVSAPLTGVILLSRGEKNHIEEVDPLLHLSSILQQIYIPQDGTNYGTKLFAIFDQFVKHAKVYSMTCRNDPEAAIVLFQGIGVDLGAPVDELY